MDYSFRKLASTAVSYARHPFGVTCLDCGFLALGEKELSTASRILLHCKGAAGCPPLEMIWCSRSLWVVYDLTYVGTDAEGIFDEVQKERRGCKGFFRYRPGWSPTGHQDMLLKALERRKNFFYVLLGSFIGSLLSLIINRLTNFFFLS